MIITLNVQVTPSHRRSIHVSLFVLWLILLILCAVAILRFIMLIMLTKYHFKHTQNAVNDTKEVGKFLRTFSVAGRIFEYLALVYGICRFSAYIRKHEDSTEQFQKTLSCKQTEIHGKYLWKKCKIIIPCLAQDDPLSPKDTENLPPNKWCICCIVTILAIFVLVYGVISAVPSIILIIFRDKLVISYQNNTGLGNAYLITAVVSYVSNSITRIAMIIATFIIGNAWVNKIETVNETQKIEDFMKSYKKTGQAVAAIQRVFQDWFVIKWIVYFIDITAYSIIAIKFLFDDQKVGKDMIMYSFIRLSYNFIAFLTLYICGTIMNKYHEKYCTKLEKRLRKFECICTSQELPETDTCLRVPWKIQCAIASLRKPKYYFSPSLCGFSIPLNNSGYTLSILIALFAFIANFLSTL